MATDCPTDVTLSPAWKRSFRKRLLDWYKDHERDLPWRKDRDPYRVWVSEVMLQQTQVETVRSYFKRFTKQFPTVKKLAAADEQQVLRLWEGLGYYRRARGLHAAAQQVVANHNGKFPDDVATLQTLPGIGRYTAGAIVSIAFDKPAPILEANTIRLFSRLVAYRGDTTSTTGQKRLWQVAEELLPVTDFSRFNQALMELGSLVCTPAEPACNRCPVAKLCHARRDGVVEEIGRNKKRIKFTEVNEAAVVIRKNTKVLVRQCGPDERWSGLWDFPRFAVETEGPLFAQREIQEKVQQQTGVTCRLGPLLKTIKHGVTRFKITLDCYDAQQTGGRIRSTTEMPARWVAPAALADYPLSTTGRKIAKLLAD